jgi:hypothetical protein
MSVQAETVQGEAQVVQVEQEYRREEKRESKAMDANLLAPKFNANPRLSAQAFSKAIDDEKRSVAFGHKSWDYCLTASHPNAVKLSEPRLTIKLDRLIVLSKSSLLGWFLHVSLIVIIKGRSPVKVSLIVIIKQV